MQILKSQIRKKLLAKRQSLPQKQTELSNKKITRKLRKTTEFKRAKIVLAYHPIHNEIDVTELILKTKKTFVLPRICAKSNRLHCHKVANINELKTGKFNIKEPSTKHPVIARNKIDLVLTPGIAFDKKGNRIGYGKGYFDKLFKTLSTDCIKIALAHDFQIIENIPAEKHDQKVDFIVTEKRIIKIH